MDIHFMKQISEKPSPDQVMRFFTRELFIRFNSPDDEVADRAYEEWEVALYQYQEHLTKIRAEMPPQLRKITELCFHDAEVLALREEEFLPLPLRRWPCSFATVINLNQDRTIWSLIYLQYEQIRNYPGTSDWPFSKSRKRWLYDEFDQHNSKEIFLHRILFGDGSILEIPFISVMASNFSLNELSGNNYVEKVA